ncbi:hypothetical protein P7K49_037559 [Saguinus oedipus]|uniref:Ig-like domain-containing protein n=1 Tax=Saguinus oedipus TaxID=9490 RepID=A0ABQ9TIF4_SAGOE|nr:hypothetical protein P7K49_037559 [Saguinus oedipus]
MCSVKGAEKSVLYSWTPTDSHASESNGDSILTISRMPCDPDLPYTCTARNPVSQSSSRPVHAGQFCTDPGASKEETMGETVVGVLGELVTLPLALPVTCRDTEKVVWMFNTSIISKEREEAATADPLIKSRDPSKNRVWVSNQDCSLKIDQLMIEDAGHYHAYVCSEASRVTSMTHVTLRIYRRLRKPKITWSLRHTEDGICRVSLTCSAEDGGNTMVYTWTPPQKEAVVLQGKSHLNISWRSGENHPNLTCIASNPSQPSVPAKLRTQLTHQPSQRIHSAFHTSPHSVSIQGSTPALTAYPFSIPHQPSQHIHSAFHTSPHSVSIQRSTPALTAYPFSIPHEPSQRIHSALHASPHSISIQHSTPALTAYPFSAPRQPSQRIHSALHASPNSASTTTVFTTPVFTAGYEKLDPPIGPARPQPRPTSDSSSDSNTTTEEDDDRPEMHTPINGRDRVNDQVTQEGAGHDSAPEAKADHDLVTPYVTEAESVVGENTVYAQVSLNLQGKTPASQKEESSATIYLSIQKPQTPARDFASEPEAKSMLFTAFPELLSTLAWPFVFGSILAKLKVTNVSPCSEFQNDHHMAGDLGPPKPPHLQCGATTTTG